MKKAEGGVAVVVVVEAAVVPFVGSAEGIHRGTSYVHLAAVVVVAVVVVVVASVLWVGKASTTFDYCHQVEPTTTAEAAVMAPVVAVVAVDGVMVAGVAVAAAVVVVEMLLPDRASFHSRSTPKPQQHTLLQS